MVVLSNADPLNVPSVKAVLTENTLGATAPTIPIDEYHAKTDEIVPRRPRRHHGA